MKCKFTAVGSHQIQSVSRSDDGSAPRDNLYSPCSLGHLSPRDRSPARTASPRQSSGKYHWNQWSLYNLYLLQLEQAAGSSGQRGTGQTNQARNDSGKEPKLHRWRFLAAVVSGLVSWGHFISSDIIDLIAQILFKLNWAGWCITKLNNEIPENWVLNLVILHYWHTIFLFWYCAVALLQFVLLKALSK